MNKRENKHAVVKINEDKSWFFKVNIQNSNDTDKRQI